MGFFQTSGILNRRGFFGDAPIIKIITTNLIFYADAGISSSYSGSGNDWKDIQGGNIGTLTNGASYSSADGGSISFDGSNDYVDYGTGLTSLDQKNKTIQVWFKKTGSSQKGIVDKEFDNNGPNYGGWGFWTQSNNKLWWWNHGGLDLKDDGSLTFSLNTWANVAVSWDNTSKTAKFYINGSLNSTKTNANIVEKASGSAKFLIGSLRNNLSGYYFDGDIASVAAYDAVLSDADILSNYNTLKGRYGF